MRDGRCNGVRTQTDWHVRFGVGLVMLDTSTTTEPLHEACHLYRVWARRRSAMVSQISTLISGACMHGNRVLAMTSSRDPRGVRQARAAPGGWSRAIECRPCATINGNKPISRTFGRMRPGISGDVPRLSRLRVTPIPVIPTHLQLLINLTIHYGLGSAFEAHALEAFVYP